MMDKYCTEKMDEETAEDYEKRITWLKDDVVEYNKTEWIETRKQWRFFPRDMYR